MSNLDSLIEALLFVKTEPLSVGKLVQILKTDADSVSSALITLKEKLSGRGVQLMMKGDEVMLGTAPEASGFIESVLKEELSRDLGKAGLETISIILYKSPVTKTDIDFIRGVNSQFIVRNLLIRGLVERIPNPAGRSFLYQPTFELLRYLGVQNVKDLPDYAQITETLSRFKDPASAEESMEASGQSETKEDSDSGDESR